MKKLLTAVLTAAMVLSVGAVGVFAAPKGPGGRYADLNHDGSCDCSGFVDSDGDGVCDNCLSVGKRPKDGTGRKNGRAAASVNGTRFTDADNDGVCDNWPGGGTRPQDGAGNQYGRGSGKSR